MPRSPRPTSSGKLHTIRPSSASRWLSATASAPFSRASKGWRRSRSSPAHPTRCLGSPSRLRREAISPSLRASWRSTESRASGGAAFPRGSPRPSSSRIRRTCEWLAKNNIHLVWGPGRHIIGHNIAIYHRNADKVRVEFFCEMDLMKDEALGYFDPRPWHQDRPQRPKVWGPDTLRNYWGFGSERIIRGYQTVE